jgi:RND family efflux transporter MFP subunit
MSIGRRVFWILLPLAIVAAGAGAAAVIISTRPQAQRTPPAARRIPVRVIVAREADHAITVRAAGTVIPARELVLQAEINGRVLWRHPELVPGGLVREHEILVRIDPRDYRAAVAQQEAQLESQRLQVMTEQRRRAVAEREWEILRQQTPDLTPSPEGRALSLREPQIRSAEAAVNAIEAQLALARRTLTKTTLRAPFSALVREADVEVGALVSPATRLATLVASDHFWVQVSVPLEQLAAIRGGVGGTGAAGAPARVRQTVGDDVVERTGRVVRVLGDLDPVGRMARVLVEIDDPLGLAQGGEPSASGLPLLLGAYVQVEIEAGVLRGAFALPRVALREGDVVWIADEGRLRIRRVRVGWRREDTVLATEGLRDGDQVIVSPLAAPVDGTDIRVVESAAEERP